MYRCLKMNMKKILILGLILIAVGSTLTAISAGNIVSTTSENVVLENNKLTINGVNFNIPEGYEEIESDVDTSGSDGDNDGDDDTNDVEDIDGTAVDKVISADFKNSAGDKIEIDVGIKANDEKIAEINPVNSEKKSINDKEGYLIKETDDGKTQYKFEYLEDGKIVKIVTNNEDLLSQIIA